MNIRSLTIGAALPTDEAGRAFTLYCIRRETFGFHAGILLESSNVGLPIVRSYRKERSPQGMPVPQFHFGTNPNDLRKAKCRLVGLEEGIPDTATIARRS